MKWHLIVVLISISLMANDVKSVADFQRSQNADEVCVLGHKELSGTEGAHVVTSKHIHLGQVFLFICEFSDPVFSALAACQNHLGKF